MVPTLTLGHSGYLKLKENKIFSGLKSGHITIVHEAVHSLIPNNKKENHLLIYLISEEAYRRITGYIIDSSDKKFLSNKKIEKRWKLYLENPDEFKNVLEVLNICKRKHFLR